MTALQSCARNTPVWRYWIVVQKSGGTGYCSSRHDCQTSSLFLLACNVPSPWLSITTWRAVCATTLTILTLQTMLSAVMGNVGNSSQVRTCLRQGRLDQRPRCSTVDLGLRGTDAQWWERYPMYYCQKDPKPSYRLRRYESHMHRYLVDPRGTRAEPVLGRWKVVSHPRWRPSSHRTGDTSQYVSARSNRMEGEQRARRTRFGAARCAAYRNTRNGWTFGRGPSPYTR